MVLDSAWKTESPTNWSLVKERSFYISVANANTAALDVDNGLPHTKTQTVGAFAYCLDVWAIHQHINMPLGKVQSFLWSKYHIHGENTLYPKHTRRFNHPNRRPRSAGYLYMYPDIFSVFYIRRTDAYGYLVFVADNRRRCVDNLRSFSGSQFFPPSFFSDIFKMLLWSYQGTIMVWSV